MKISPVLLALLLIAPGTDQAAASTLPAAPSWHVYFSPQGGCTKAVVAAIQKAKTDIHVAAYSFTSAPIAAALRDAFRRGVKVEVVLDKSQETEHYSSATFLANAGISTSIDAVHAIMHNKFMVIDGSVVLTGSFNFTKAAEQKNAENLMVIQDSALAGQYLENWRTHRAHAHEYRGKIASRS